MSNEGSDGSIWSVKILRCEKHGDLKELIKSHREQSRKKMGRVMPDYLDGQEEFNSCPQHCPNTNSVEKLFVNLLLCHIMGDCCEIRALVSHYFLLELMSSQSHWSSFILPTLSLSPYATAN